MSYKDLDLLSKAQLLDDIVTNYCSLEEDILDFVDDWVEEYYIQQENIQTYDEWLKYVTRKDDDD